jgi:hypothetical protein
MRLDVIQPSEHTRQRRPMELGEESRMVEITQ